MSVWFVLWFVLSFALLYFLGWTIYILMRQKKSWKAFAVKKKLRYTQTKFLSSPEMSGVIEDYTTAYFTAEHQPADGRNTRKLTSIEMSLSSRMPFEGGAASGGMVPLIRAANFKEEFLPTEAEWNKEWIICGDNRNALETYFTPERLKILISLMKIKNAWVILLFRKDVMLLRVDTPDPLDSEEKLEKISKFMAKAARVFELGAGEAGKLQLAMKQAPRKVAAKTEAVENAASLELEEEIAKEISEGSPPQEQAE